MGACTRLRGVELEHLTLSAVCRCRGDGGLIRSDGARGRGGGGYASLRAGLRGATRSVGLQRGVWSVDSAGKILEVSQL